MLIPIVAAVALATAPVSTADPRIPVMRDRLVALSPLIRALGVNPRDFIFRLDYLTGRIANAPESSPALRGDLETQTRLELKLDAELLINRCPIFAAIDGLDESWYNSDPLVPPDPVAFYVPKPDDRGRYALVVLLHGERETETDVLTHELFRRLADRSHAILVAPWGTGSLLWGDPAATEVANVVAQVEQAFPVDPRHIYLAGVASGGTGVFHVAALRPGRFAAVLAVNAKLRADDAFAVRHSLTDRGVYLVDAGHSANAPSDMQLGAFQALANACVPVSLYQAPLAGDDFYQIGDTIERAWNDMFDGTIRDPSTRECNPVR